MQKTNSKNATSKDVKNKKSLLNNYITNNVYLYDKTYKN